MTVMMPQRHRAAAKKPMWIIVLLSLVCVVLIGAYVFPPRRYSKCYLFASSVCTPFKDWLPSMGRRERTDEEIISSVVIRDILSMPMPVSKNPKIALMFLTPGSLPFEKLWEKFLQGHEGRYSIYVHASREKPVHTSSLFAGRDIHSDAVIIFACVSCILDLTVLRPLLYQGCLEETHIENQSDLTKISFIKEFYYDLISNRFKSRNPEKEVVWGLISMVDAEKRLLANALEDVDNQFFVLLSDSCVPLHSFDYVYNYLMGTNVSFVDCHAETRFNDSGGQPVLQEVQAVLQGNLPFSRDLQPAEGRNCIADEHYLPTLFNMVDPGGISNWSVTNVDWSEGKWHPRSYSAADVTYDLLKNITAIDENVHVTSDDKKLVMQKPCLWNGSKRPCYLFARKFNPEALDNLLKLFTSYTSA
ncbi:hypothetical protein BAE44_0016692 [Dichanthelium oligosanthes]|uniref:Uncharacterized protein n=1 Tax=Dichanthelium oligosanthes TaxID=888268 RepID=A0A1E5VAV7_9POAL|nr:hypothetical protein BAE44_0016692 [Dichanthelium oligosanthes]